MKKYFFIPLIATIGFIKIGILASGGTYSILVDLPSLAITIGLSFCLLLTQFSFKEIGKSFKVAMESNISDEKIIKKSLLFFQTAQKLFIASGIMGPLLGFIIILSYPLDKENFSKGLSVALLSALYVVIFVFVITIPYISALKKKLLINR